MKMKVVLEPCAFMPTRAHEADAGLDLYSPQSGAIFRYDTLTIDTGVHIEIPKNCVGFVKSKSGLMVNCDVVTDGTIDAGYTGSIRVKLFNHGNEVVKIEKGQKIAQLVILPIKRPRLKMVAGLKKTERGNGGFGSTGRF